MNKYLLLKELKRNKTILFIWMGVIAFFTIFVMSFYPSIAKMGDQLKALIDSFPPGMTKAFGMDMASWTDILSYYSTYYGMHIMIFMTIFSATLAAGILSKEEREGTADFLLTRPISRIEVVGSKVIAFSILFFLLFFMQIFLAWGGMKIFATQEYDVRIFTIMHFYGFILNIFFAGLGIFISLFPKRSKSITGAIVGVVIGSFIINALSRISADTEWIAWISPFHYADFQVTAYDYNVDLWRVSVLGGLGILFFILTFLRYRKKDIYT